MQRKQQNHTGRKNRKELRTKEIYEKCQTFATKSQYFINNIFTTKSHRPQRANKSHKTNNKRVEIHV